jgi:hypothetical protein
MVRNYFKFLVLTTALAWIFNTHTEFYFTHIINNSGQSFTIGNTTIFVPAATTYDMSSAPLVLQPQQPLILLPEDDPELEVVIVLQDDPGLKLIHPNLAQCTITMRKINMLANGTQYVTKFPTKTMLCKRGENILEIDSSMTRNFANNRFTIRIAPTLETTATSQRNLLASTRQAFPSPFTPGGRCVPTSTDFFVPGFTQKGTLCEESYISTMLHPGQEIERDYLIYLPHGYFENPEKRYPVLFYLHGTPSSPQEEAPGYAVIMDLMIASQRISPMIVVFPNGNVDFNQFLGLPYGELPQTYQFIFNERGQLPAYWANSVVLGNMEDDIVFELYNHIDATYRTKKGKQYKAVNGFSGGGGGQYMVLPHSDRFGAVSTSSGFGVSWELEILIYPVIDAIVGQLAFDGGFTDTHLTTFYEHDPLDTTNPFANYLGAIYNQALVFSPDPMAQYLAQLPIDEHGNIRTDIAQQWIQNSATTRAFLYQQDILRNKLCIYHDAGAYDFFYNLEFRNPSQVYLFDVTRLQGGYYNTTNGFYSDILTQLGINHEFISYQGNHNQYSGLQTITTLMFHSAVFALKDPNRAKFMGKGEVVLRDNAAMVIMDNAALGIETDLLYTATTDLLFTLNDYGRIQIGNQSNRGGALQVGNSIDPISLQQNPSLADQLVSWTVVVDGAGAELQINRHGFMGLGVGIQGHNNETPNQFVVESLENVQHVGIQLREGTLRHSQIFGGDDPRSALMAIGPAQNYQINFNTLKTRILGGGNLIRVEDANKLQPTFVSAFFETERLTGPEAVTYQQGTFAGLVSQGIRPLMEMSQTNTVLTGFLNKLVSLDGAPEQGINVIDVLPFTIQESFAHTNTLEINVLSSQPLLVDTTKGPRPQHATPQQFFNYLKTDGYDRQANKRAAISLNNSLIAYLVYLENLTNIPGQDLIVRLRQDQFPNETARTTFPDTDGESPNSDTITRGVPRGAVGILLSVNPPRILSDIFDLEDSGQFEESI